ncbi:hypothetical protein JW859_04950 [bacterium]|nr:hypothetical protein [bacterium]
MPNTKAAASEEAKQPTTHMPALTVLERTTGIQLSNRFIWLVFIAALYLIGQLTYVQWQTGQAGHPRFDTLDLMSLIMAIIEAALVLTALMVALGTERTRQAWYKRFPQHPFSYLAAGVGGCLVVWLMLALLLAPVLYFHRYPELVSEAQVRIPLMMLQRSMLVSCAVLISYNFLLMLRYVLRCPWWLAGGLSVIGHVAMGYLVSYYSYHMLTLERLNYVFYYNHLWKYTELVPMIQLSVEYHNVEMPYFAYFLGAGSIAAILVMLLWLPRASSMSAKEIIPQPPEA